MLPSIQKIVTRIKNELRALKVASPLNVGTLNFPEQAPSVSYSGTIDTTGQSFIVARLAVTFTRTDGQAIPPFVDFAFDYGVSPTYQEYMASQGVQITGNDPNVSSEFYILGYLEDAENSSATYYIDVTNAIAGFASSSISLNVNVQALSTVEGTLTLQRII